MTPTAPAPTPLAPLVDPLAALAIARATRGAPHLEYHLRATWDEATRTITAVELLARGNRTRVPALPLSFPAGCVALHTHPAGVSTEPSDADIAAADEFARLGVGFAICGPLGEALHVVTTPAAVRNMLPRPESPARRAWLSRVRRWRLGRLSLELRPRGPIPA